MIDIEVNKDKKRLYLVINGKTYEDDTAVLPVPLSGSGDGVGVVITPPDPVAVDLLLKHCLSEFPSKIWTLTLRSWATTPPRFQSVDDEQIAYDITVFRTNNGKLLLAFDFIFNKDRWKRLWSISEYREEFNRILKEQKILKEIPPDERVAIFPYGSTDGRHDVLLPLPDASATLEDAIFQGIELLEGLHNSSRVALLSRLQGESVIERFEFPETARIACEQYLIYFVQFLNDVGVEATAELHHEAGQVLFAVTPKNRNEALDKIRAALHIYLSLATRDFDGAGRDVAMQRLAANVYHLRSQLTLAQALIETKNATIQAQQVMIGAQQLGITNGIILDSLVAPVPDAKGEAELVFDGLAEITKYEGKGFRVNLPEIFRRVKRCLRRVKSDGAGWQILAADTSRGCAFVNMM